MTSSNTAIAFSIQFFFKQSGSNNKWMRFNYCCLEYRLLSSICLQDGCRGCQGPPRLVSIGSRRSRTAGNPIPPCLQFVIISQLQRVLVVNDFIINCVNICVLPSFTETPPKIFLRHLYPHFNNQNIQPCIVHKITSETIRKARMSVFNHKNMEYRFLGNTGLRVSIISFGNMINYKPENEQVDDEIFIKCLENGINFFDTAEVYAAGECEKALGRAIKKSKVEREDLVITTKVWSIGSNVNTVSNTSRKHIMDSVDASLKRLDLEYVDVVFAHAFDSSTPMEEICRGFNQVIEDGKAFYWATSNWTADQIFEAFGVCDRLNLHRPIAEQVQYNMLIRKEVEVQFEKLLDKYKFGLTVWSPLAGGFLTGKYLDSIPQESRVAQPSYFGENAMKNFFYDPHNNEKTKNSLRALQKLAQEMGYTLAQLAMAWVLKNPNVSTAITGARSVEQLQDTLKSFQLYRKWTPELEVKVNALLDTTPTTKMNFYTWSHEAPRRPVK